MISTMPQGEETWTSCLQGDLRPSLICHEAWQLKLPPQRFTGLQLRLAMVCVLREAPNAFNLVAPDCGSFSIVSRGTSQRSTVSPLGREPLPFVSRGNMTISRWAFWFCFISPPGARIFLQVLYINRLGRGPVRLVLLLLLMVACHTIWCLEQPKGSKQVLSRNPRFEWMCNRVLYVLWQIGRCFPLPVHL